MGQKYFIIKNILLLVLSIGSLEPTGKFCSLSGSSVCLDCPAGELGHGTPMHAQRTCARAHRMQLRLERRSRQRSQEARQIPVRHGLEHLRREFAAVEIDHLFGG
jgi:hypothetical protein